MNLYEWNKRRIYRYVSWLYKRMTKKEKLTIEILENISPSSRNSVANSDDIVL